MIGTEVILTLILVRLVLPLGLLVVLGELVRRREATYWFRS